MLKIGITGGIGSGKTTVCRVFETLGIPVFYADTVAKDLMVADPLLVAGVKNAFGEESYFEHQVLNKAHIAQIVFNNDAELARLNALVHPAVFRAFDQWVAMVPAHSPYILKEAALLFESESYKMCDKTIVVVAAHDLKKSRVMLRDQVTEAQVQARMDKQFSDEHKIKMADYLIHNEESSSIILQVLALHEQFIK
jgi:dephospho-CoA kinase